MSPSLRKDIIEWDVPNWAECLKVWQPIIDKLPRSATILAIGERNGGLSLWLALQGFNVLCTDRTESFEKAKGIHKKYGVENKIRYAVVDITNPDLPDSHFDLIIMKSVLGGLKADYGNAQTRNTATQQQAIHNILSLLKPGGYLLSADNMKGNLLLNWLRNTNGKSKGWHYFSYQQLIQLMQPFSSHTIDTFGILPTLFSSPILNSIVFFKNKHLLQWLPPSTKYIAITAACKGF